MTAGATLVHLAFAPPGPAGAVEWEAPSVMWDKPPPGLLLDQSGEAFDPARLQGGPRPSHAKRLECLRDVTLMWSDLFMVDGAVHAIYDGGAANAAARVADHPELSRYTGLRRCGDGVAIPQSRLDGVHSHWGPVLFATSDEPHNWGLWLVYVLPAVVHFVRNRDRYQKLMVFCTHPNMRAFLALLGVREEDIIQHDCGATYWFEELHVFRQSMRDLYIAPEAHALYRQLARMMVARHGPGPHRAIYVARLRRTRELHSYRALQNEQALADRLAAEGYTVVEPEFMAVPDQIRAFAGARRVVTLGGAGLFNTVFCDRARVMDIESTPWFVEAHSNIFAGTGLPYGLAIGREDPADASPAHRRWSIDLDAAWPAIAAFMG